MKEAERSKAEVLTLQEEAQRAKHEAAEKLQELEQRSNRKAEEVLTAQKGVQKEALQLQLQLQETLAAEKSQCAKLREEVEALRKQNASLAQMSQSESEKIVAWQTRVQMLEEEKKLLNA
jgi:hypothetical protein